MPFSLSNLLNPVPALESVESDGALAIEPSMLSGISETAASSLPQLTSPSMNDYQGQRLASIASIAESEMAGHGNYPPLDDPYPVDNIKSEYYNPGRSASVTSQTFVHNDIQSGLRRQSYDLNLDGSAGVFMDSSQGLSAFNEHDGTAVHSSSKDRSTVDPTEETAEERAARSTKHSSKNEGQHTDRRYLCYLCNKLFTRRRSVRDHISKIHNTKTWEPVRSLEIVVHPHTGEPVEPLEVTIARGPPPPAAKPPREKSEKPKAEKKQKLDSLEEIPEEQEEAVKEETSEPQPEEASVMMEEVPVEEPVLEPVVQAVPIQIPTSTTIATLKTEPSIASSRASSVDTTFAPAPVIGKKRPAASELAKPLPAAVTKKGTAKLRGPTPNKRAKISDNDSTGNATPTFRSPSATPASATVRTPASKLKKQTAAVSQASSPTPASSRAASAEVASPSPSASTTPGSSNDDGEVFCICRKGDNHTWMIACDGGCDEWFHGNCVHIRERDGDLIDRYICPNCARDGLVTTWKRMCRRKDCRKPARVMDKPPSKYCSPECGRLFFVELVRRGDPWINTNKNGQLIVESGRVKKLRKKRQKVTASPSKPVNQVLTNAFVETDRESRLATPAYSDDEKSEYETDSSVDDDLLPNRGGALRAGEVKALIDKCKTIEGWRELGKKPVTPPREEDDKTEGINGVTESHPQEVVTGYDEYEESSLANISKELKSLKHRDQILVTREKFLDAVKARSAAITDEVKKSNSKLKDPCGFDPRLAWSEEEFMIWCDEKGGRELLQNGKIGAPESLDLDKVLTNGTHLNGDVDAADISSDEDDSEKMPQKGGVCIKNRCPRHKNWAKASLAEIRFEQDVIRRKRTVQEATRDEIMERARWRMREMQDD